MTSEERRIRDEVERYRRRPVADALWALAIESFEYEDVEVVGAKAVPALADRIRAVELGVGRRAARPLGPREAKGVSAARSVALGKVYAHAASQGARKTGFDIRAIRRSLALKQMEARRWEAPPGSDSDRIRAVEREAARRVSSGECLLSPDDVPGWVAGEHYSALGLPLGASGDDEVAAISAARRNGRREDTLHYLAEGSTRLLTVVHPGVLYDLAGLSKVLVETYRFDLAPATMLVLTGEAPTVPRWSATVDVRYGDHGATTRMTLVLDPEMTEPEVLAAYRSARDHIRGNRKRARPLSEKAVEQAAWMARRPTGETWEQHRRAWNREYAGWKHAGPATNFARDVKGAASRLLDPGWGLPLEGSQRGSQPEATRADRPGQSGDKEP